MVGTGSSLPSVVRPGRSARSSSRAVPGPGIAPLASVCRHGLVTTPVPQVDAASSVKHALMSDSYLDVG